MHAKEIVIADPMLNDDEFRRTSHPNPDRALLFEQLARENRITPRTHPRVCEPCAGEGPAAYMVTSLGWKPKNIYCIDRYAPQKPIVPGVHWLFWDLLALGDALDNGVTLPREVARYKRTFDIVVFSFGTGPKYLTNEAAATICTFFVRSGGFIFTVDFGVQLTGIAR